MTTSHISVRQGYASLWESESTKLRDIPYKYWEENDWSFVYSNYWGGEVKWGEEGGGLWGWHELSHGWCWYCAVEERAGTTETISWCLALATRHPLSVAGLQWSSPYLTCPTSSHHNQQSQVSQPPYKYLPQQASLGYSNILINIWKIC